MLTDLPLICYDAATAMVIEKPSFSTAKIPKTSFRRPLPSTKHQCQAPSTSAKRQAPSTSVKHQSRREHNISYFNLWGFRWTWIKGEIDGGKKAEQLCKSKLQSWSVQSVWKGREETSKELLSPATSVIKLSGLEMVLGFTGDITKTSWFVNFHILFTLRSRDSLIHHKRQTCFSH